jgi:hypothetical protein
VIAPFHEEYRDVEWIWEGRILYGLEINYVAIRNVYDYTDLTVLMLNFNKDI